MEFQVVFTTTVCDIYIPVIYLREQSCTISVTAMYDVLVITVLKS